MTDDRDPAAGDADFEDPDLRKLADEILEGAPVDWAHMPADVDPALLEQLHVLASLADVHRTPERDDPGALDTTSALGTWGPLTLLERIGSGAFGEVYRAWDTRLDREVALKLLHRRERESPDQPRRSIQEGRLLARIRHPNVVTVYGAERIDGQSGIWTEFVHGETLAVRLHERGPFPAAEAVAIGIDLCRALAAAHAVGLLHRDIKTQNVMREPTGRIVLVDFGASEDSRHPAMDAPTRLLTGTPLYLAPELWTGGSPSVQTDIYALGVLLYHLVTGSYPVEGASADAIRKAHQAMERTHLSAAGTGLPAWFVTAVDRAIDPDPSRRFENANALESALTGSPEWAGPSVVPVDRPTPGRRPRTHRVGLTLAGVALFAVVGAALLMTGRDANVRLPAPPPLPGQARTAPLRADPLPSDGVSPPAASNQGGDTTSHASSTVGAPDPTAQTDGSRHPPVRVGMPPGESPAPTFHSIRMVEGFAKVGGPSRDGRHVPYVDANGDIVVWEKPTGRREVAVKHDAGPGQFSFPLMSPEGDRIVFQATVSDEYELRIINADGSGPGVLLAKQSELAPLPIEWSKDGRQILCWLRKNTNQYWDLTLVPVDGGPPRVVRHFDDLVPVRASLSGDGRFVVYDLPSPGPRSPRDLFVVGTDGSPPRVLLEDPANEQRPLWTPNDAYVFFQSNRSGSEAAWIVPIAEGAAAGPPRMLAKDVAAFSDWSMTDDGALYYPVQEPFSEDLSVAFDPGAAVQSAEPVPFFTKVHGTHFGFAWSPGGESIAYVVSTPRDGLRPSPHPYSLSILDGVSKVPRTFTLDGALAFVGEHPPRWAPDGRGLAVWARSNENRWGYFRLDARTGASAPILLVDRYRPGLVDWSPDGTALLFFDPLRGIVARELTSGAETIAVDNEAWPSGQPGVAVGLLSFVASPDGRSIGVTARDKSGHLALISQRLGGERRELVNVSAPRWLDLHGWTPEGDALIYSELRGDTKRRQLWRAPVDGSPPQRLATPAALETSSASYISLSPDGRKLGYTDVATVWDLCILENFLPSAR